jgi:hypothetical protein
MMLKLETAKENPKRKKLLDVTLNTYNEQLVN